MSTINDELGRLVLNAIRLKFSQFDTCPDMRLVNGVLRAKAGEKYGLGPALLAAWGHGIGVGHVPLEIDGKPLVVEETASETYRFVRVELRDYRNETAELQRLEIQEKNPDPLRLVYHEDGLVSTLSFPDHRVHGLEEDDVREILYALNQQGFLTTANLDNRQIQFKDLTVKHLLEERGEATFIVASHQKLRDSSFRLPAGLDHDTIRNYVNEALKRRQQCNYCSVHALNRKEATVHSAHAGALDTVRSYEFGFTFAPFGDPLSICHFLAWDTPAVSDVVMNMDPQAYSFGDLIRLMRHINSGVRDLAHDLAVSPGDPISGICNHWAGNSIYHQHYQFFRLPLPRALTSALDRTELIAEHAGVEVRRVLGWMAPLYVIAAPPERKVTDEDVTLMADRVAREWDLLSEGFDSSYGNGITIQNHSQNTFATLDGDRIVAVFIPRHRRKLNADSTSTPKGLKKLSAGTLEMLGYFIIDKRNVKKGDPPTEDVTADDFESIKELTDAEREKLGASWLAQLAPDQDAIDAFEAGLRLAFQPTVARYQERISLLASTSPAKLGTAMWDLATIIRRDPKLDEKTRGHLYLELLSLLQTLAPR